MSLGAKSSMLIIGSGGGAEVSIARKLGASRIVAVEVNPAINEIATGPLGEWTGHVFDHPSVELHTDEGRSFLERQDRRFGLIISAHTISNAAVASGAMALSENHLFTVEAFEDYLAHLDENGLLVVTRPEFQLPRLLVMADAALRAAGHTQGLEGRLLAYRAGKKEASGYGFTACIIIAPNGFSEQQYTLFDKHMGRPNLSPIWDRKGVADSKDALLLQAIVAGPDDAELARLASESERELSLATDDRPFFNQTMPWSRIDLETIETFLGQNEKARIALEEQPVAQLSLLLVLGSGCLVALLGLVVAVLLCRPREIHGLPTASLYFAALGLGFMLVEVSMIQKLTLLVGQPTHTLVVCLAGILVFSGLGSWFSYKIGDGLAKAIATKAAIAAGSVVAFALIADLVVELAIGMPTAARMAVALGLTAAPAFFMGYLFPMGMRGLAATQPNPSVSQRALGFVWGVNGFFSVLGSVLATTLAMVTGFRLVLLIGALIYALAAYAGYTALKPTTTG